VKEVLDVTSISAIVASGGVLVGVVFAALQLRDLVKTRQTDILMRLYSTFGSTEFLKARNTLWESEDYHDYVEKHGSLEATQVGIFFEAIGVLLHRKLIDVGLVDDLLGPSVTKTWEKIESTVEGWRTQYSSPELGAWFEYLYNEMNKRGQTLPTLQ